MNEATGFIYAKNSLSFTNRLDYSRLGDLPLVDKPVVYPNIFGIVISVSIPKRCKSIADQNYSVVIGIRDPSYVVGRDVDLTVNWFTNTPYKDGFSLVRPGK